MDELKTYPVGKLLIRLIIPSLAIVLVSGSYNIIDGIFLGRTLGIVGTSANSYTFMIYALVYGFSALISQGASSLLAIKLGEGSRQTGEQILAISFVMSIIIAIIQSLLIYFSLDILLAIFGADEIYHPYIKEFCAIFLLGSPFYFVAHTLLYCIRAQGNVRKVLFINILSFTTNLVLGAIFIARWGMGFTGSALSTVCANIAMCIVALRHYTSKKCSITLNKASFVINIALCKEIITMGFPFFFTNFISILLLTGYNRIAFRSANAWGVAALSIASSIYRYIISLMNAITNGIQPVIGFNFGAKLYKRVRLALIYSILISTAFSTTCFLGVQIFAVSITRLFNSDSIEFISYASLALKRVLLSLPLQGVISVGTNYFQYIGEGKKSTLLVILRQIVFQIPLALTLSYYQGINGLWDSYWLSDILVAIIILSLLLFQVNNMKNFNYPTNQDERGTQNGI